MGFWGFGVVELLGCGVVGKRASEGLWASGLVRGCGGQAWNDVDDRVRDVILLVKQFMASRRLSQQPVVVAPRALLERVTRLAPMACRPRNEFSDRQQKEFRKTADRITRF